MKQHFEVSEEIPASPQQVYHAWLDSDQHSAMTGGEAIASDLVGDSFTAWDGYIEGKNVELDKGSRIVQHWRTSEFEDGDEDSLLEIEFKASRDNTLVTIRHSNLPEHGMQYKMGWVENYFIPMKAYFSKSL
jgi:uncharacterized protein YndB with AHSA1/START domain